MNHKHHLKADASNDGIFVSADGDPDALYCAIGAVTADALKHIIPELQTNLPPKALCECFCKTLGMLLRDHFGEQYEVPITAKKEPQGEQNEDDKKPTPEEVMEMMVKLGPDGLKELTRLQVNRLIDKMSSGKPKE